MLTPEKIIRFARVLVDRDGWCNDIYRPIEMACSQCPFYCLGELTGSRGRALDKAKNYLDVYIKNMIEEE